MQEETPAFFVTFTIVDVNCNNVYNRRHKYKKEVP